MIETATLITLCMLYLIFFRPGKTPPLQNLLVIERPGQYHLTLAPKLNLAQPFIEALASQIGSSGEAGSGSLTRFFEVHDPQVVAHGFDYYLLALTQRAGKLYVQAAPPVSADQNLHTISEFAQAVLTRFPDDEATASGDNLVAAAQHMAGLRGIRIKTL